MGFKVNNSPIMNIIMIIFNYEELRSRALGYLRSVRRLDHKLASGQALFYNLHSRSRTARYFGCQNKKIVCLIIVFFINLYSYAEDSINTYFPESDITRNWIVGFTSLKGINLLTGNQYLIHSIPQLIEEKLTMLDEHVYSPAEKEEYQKNLLQNKIGTFIGQLIGQKESLDSIFFKNPDTVEYKTAYENYIEAEEQLLGEIEYLRAIDYREIPFPEKSPIVIYNQNNSDGVLLDYPDFSIYEYARQNKIDLLISGEIEQIQEYFYIRISAMHIESNKEIFVFENALSSETIYEFLPELINELIGIILGRDWANLTIIPEPADSVIQIDGKVEGIGKVQKNYIVPGMVEIEIFHHGYDPVTELIFLSAFEDKVIEIALEQMETQTILLNSNPPYADIYLNSYWIGKTPLLLDLPYESQLLIIQKEGYDDLSYKFTEEIPEELNFLLREDLIDELYWHEQKRNRFYATLGVWLISLPVPFFVSDYYSDISDQNPTDSTMRRRLEVLDFTKTATIILTTGLFVNMIIHLIDYLNYSRQLIPSGLED